MNAGYLQDGHSNFAYEQESVSSSFQSALANISNQTSPKNYLSLQSSNFSERSNIQTNPTEISNFQNVFYDTDYGLSRPKQPQDVALVWQNLHFRSGQRHIIQGITGDLLPGQLKAIIGPSGVGKSTLLKIITGRLREGVSGRVYLRNGRHLLQKEQPPFTVAYIPQADHHYPRLTVRETLYIASQIKNTKSKFVANNTNSDDNSETKSIDSSMNSIESAVWMEDENVQFKSRSSHSHAQVVEQMLNQLLLTNCADTLVYRCSGGQVKRLSIATELLSNPQMLVLDEPTTGLDFVAALQTIRTLNSLLQKTIRPPGILCTIHQPSSSLLALCTHMYVLGVGGRALYHGHTEDMVDTLAHFGLQCPRTYNPADFVLQIAYGHHGNKPLEQMALKLCKMQRSLLIESHSSLHCNLPLAFQSGRDVLMQEQFERQRACPANGGSTISHVRWLTWRGTLNYSRDPVFVAFSFLNYVIGALLTGGGYKDHVGELSGCYERRWVRDMSLNELCRELGKLTENGSLFMFTGIHLTYMCVVFPVVQLQSQLPMLVREQLNSWYALRSFCASTLLVLVTHFFLVQLLYVTILYPLSGQRSDYSAYGIWIGTSSLLGLINVLLGLIMGALAVHDAFIAIMLCLCITSPTISTSFSFVHDQTRAWVADAVRAASYQNYYLHSTLQAVYGSGRCDSMTVKEIPDELREDYDSSFILRVLDYSSGSSWAGWTFNSVSVLVMLVLYYVILRWRLKKSAAV